jgi:glycine/D-amino acid oxidase-like deaminating enzyme
MQILPLPISMELPAKYSGRLPPACDVVVIGGGVMGVSAALELAARGQKVVLCEKGRIAGEQSSRNWGWIRQQGRDLAELPVMMESLSIWKTHAEKLPKDLGFAQQGVVYLALTAAEMDGFETWAQSARAQGLQTQLLSRSDVVARFGTGSKWVGGLETPSDARAEPWRAVPLLADYARTQGVLLREGCAVRRLDVTNGAITGVFTESGRIACNQVVVAGGAWSSLFLRNEGIDIPQLSVRSSVGIIPDQRQTYAGNAADDSIGFRARMDGGTSLAPGFAHDFYIGPDAFRHFSLYWPQFKKDHRATHLRAMAPRGFPDAWGTARRWRADEVSPFEAMRILNPAPNTRALARAARDFAAAFGGEGAQFSHQWAGMIDMMPDVVPVISNVTIAGLTIATGLSGHGFGIGPGFGRVVADLALGREVGHDLTRFRLTRFSDGSVIAPGPSL